MTFLLIAGFAVIAVIDLPPLIKEKKVKDIVVFALFFLAAFIVALLQLWGVDIPSVIKGIRYILETLLKIPS